MTTTLTPAERGRRAVDLAATVVGYALLFLWLSQSGTTTNYLLHVGLALVLWPLVMGGGHWASAESREHRAAVVAWQHRKGQWDTRRALREACGDKHTEWLDRLDLLAPVEDPGTRPLTAREAHEARLHNARHAMRQREKGDPPKGPAGVSLPVVPSGPAPGASGQSKSVTMGQDGPPEWVRRSTDASRARIEARRSEATDTCKIAHVYTAAQIECLHCGEPDDAHMEAEKAKARKAREARDAERLARNIASMASTTAAALREYIDAAKAAQEAGDTETVEHTLKRIDGLLATVYPPSADQGRYVSWTDL